MSICNPVGTLQVALGRTDIGFYWTIFRIVTNTLFIYVGALFSINGLALAILAYNIFVIFPFWYMQYRPMLQISFLTYLKSNIYQFIVAILCAIPFVLLFYANTNIVVSIVIGIIYISLYITIMKKVDKDNYILTLLLAQIKNKITHNE
jgi:O-antigen/teichoic acid export membrane protein